MFKKKFPKYSYFEGSAINIYNVFICIHFLKRAYSYKETSYILMAQQNKNYIINISVYHRRSAPLLSKSTQLPNDYKFALPGGMHLLRGLLYISFRLLVSFEKSVFSYVGESISCVIPKSQMIALLLYNLTCDDCFCAF